MKKNHENKSGNLPRKVTRRTAALCVIALLLFAIGGVVGVRAALGITSENYIAEFELQDLDVILMENGTGVTDLDYTLLSNIEENLRPGYAYNEVLTAKHNGTTKMYLSINLRKYWKDPDGNKTTALDPSMIHLTFGNGDYNSTNWVINPKETTAERTTYYYRKVLESGATTEPLVDHFSVDGQVVNDNNISIKQEGNTYTYTYIYNGYKACIEADVQGLQDHNPNDAIKSLWGINNVHVAGEKLSVE